jgi:uncharacterized protein (DUF488 family)
MRNGSEKPKVYTLGYQGIKLADYVAKLTDSNIGVVLDVRENAWSYKPGFSKTPLAKALTEAGIEYVHVPSAGNPSSNRKTATSASECLDRYRVYLDDNPACLDELMAHIKRASDDGRFTCLTCFERQPSECHRSILIEALLAIDPRLDTTHL